MSYSWTMSDGIAEEICDEDVEALDNDFNVELRSMLPRVQRRSVQTDSTVTYDSASGKRPTRPSCKPTKRCRTSQNNSK